MEQEKLDEIKHILSVKRTASVNELAEKLYVSTATVRRALNILEKDGVLKRTHGGAVRVKNPDDESAFNARLLLNQPLKKRVAAAASVLLKDHATIFMDSSSTVGCVVPFLEDFDRLTVVTNGIRTAFWLSQLKNVNVSIACGEVKNFGNSVLGSRTLDWIRTMSFDYALVSTSGVSAGGWFTDANADQCEIKKYLLKTPEKPWCWPIRASFTRPAFTRLFPATRPITS